MKFLGLAANYSVANVFRHLFAWGSKQDGEKLKSALAKRYKSRADRVLLYHTGRSALAAAIESVAPKGAKVMVATPTCIAVVRAVRAAGCTPVYVDAAEGEVQFGAEEIAAALEQDHDISAIIIQNTLGVPVKMHLIEKLCKENNLKIIEDLAHCAGRFYPDGREVGTVGAATALSFGKGKAIDTISGGALILRERNAKLPNPPAFKPQRADRWRDRWYPFFALLARGLWNIKVGKWILGGLVKFGWIQKSADAELNLDVRLTAWQAKLAYQQLGELPRTVPKALSVAAEGVLANPPLREWRLVEHRDQALTELEQHGYNFREIWYDEVISPQRYMSEAELSLTALPHAAKLVKRIVNIPTCYSEESLKAAYKIIEKYEVET